jgi:hypothetical protein
MRIAKGSSFSGHGLALLLAGAVVAAWVGVMALSLRQASLPPETDGLVLVAFPPGTSDADAFAAVVRAGGEPIRPTWLDFVWLVHGGTGGFVGRLEREGALAAFGELSFVAVLGGCAAVSVDDRHLPAYHP